MPLLLQVLLNEKAQKVSEQQYQLSHSGRTISADKVYVCIGGKPNTGFLKSGSSGAILDGRGYVKVGSSLCSCYFLKPWLLLICDVASLAGVKPLQALHISCSEFHLRVSECSGRNA